MEPERSPLPPPLSSRYPSPPTLSPVPNGAQPELSSLGVPYGRSECSEDRFPDYEEQDQCDESRNKANFAKNMEGEEKQSPIVKKQIPNGNSDTLQTRTVNPTADPSHQRDTIDEELANILQLALTEESDLSDPPDEVSSEESEESDFEDGNNSSSDKDEGDADEPANSSLPNKNKIKKKQQKRAINAREYVTRLHQNEDKRYSKQIQRQKGKKVGANGSRKRKVTGNDTESRKTLKMADGSSISVFNDGSSPTDGNSLRPMEPIKAKTHAEQFAQLKAAQLKAQIPQNCDTRRRNTQSQDLQEAARLFGYKRVEAENGRWKLKGMETALEGQQLTAVAWMVKRELSRCKPFGGLLADAPGMGKTVMSLACIVGNQADDEHVREYCNATLVVVPNKGFGKQWEDEAHRHCKSPIKDKVFVYRLDQTDLMDRCKTSFIVIATYSDLMAEYPDDSVFQELKGKYGSDDISLHREFEARVGTIFKINWYRIILDEAHAIKNINTRTSRACCALLGKYRWALSGTPLANSSDEMYPYLKFTECESTLSSKEFKSMYTSNGESNSHFEALTSLIMYRRTHNDEFLGHKIINLPEKKEINLLVPLSREEQIVVNAVKMYYQKKSTRLKQGKLGKAESEAMIDNLDDLEETELEEKGHKKAKTTLEYASQVRKRQAISHAFCIERLLRHSFEPEDLRELVDAFGQISMKQTIIEQIRMNLGEDHDISRYETGLRILQQREEAVFGGHFDMKTLLKLAMCESSLRRNNCLFCQKPPVDPVHSDDCGHIFCLKCICRAARENYRAKKDIRCPHKDCGERLVVGDEIETVQTKIDSKDKSYIEPGRDSHNVTIRQEDSANGFFICSTLLDDAPMVPSTRLTATMAIALTWLHEAPDDKILIFTQFIGTAKILGYMLSKLDIGFVYFWGGLPTGQKRKALEAMKESADVKVMVATLKSGGQCLNLTSANRVIIIDPWWNKTAEQQAFGRVTRIGQQKETYLVTIKTEEETDSRIHTLQLKKAADVDYTLQDDGHMPPEVSELQLQQELLRRKSQQEEKQKKKAAREAKKKKA